MLASLLSGQEVGHPGRAVQQHGCSWECPRASRCDHFMQALQEGECRVPGYLTFSTNVTRVVSGLHRPILAATEPSLQMKQRVADLTSSITILKQSLLLQVL